MDPDNKIGCRNLVVDVIIPAYFELLVRPGPRQRESRKILQISRLRCKIAALIMYCMTNIRLRISLILSNQNWILNLCSWKLHNWKIFKNGMSESPTKIRQSAWFFVHRQTRSLSNMRWVVLWARLWLPNTRRNWFRRKRSRNCLANTAPHLKWEQNKGKRSQRNERISEFVRVRPTATCERAYRFPHLR